MSRLETLAKTLSLRYPSDESAKDLCKELEVFKSMVYQADHAAKVAETEEHMWLVKMRSCYEVSDESQTEALSKELDEQAEIAAISMRSALSQIKSLRSLFDTEES